MIDIDKHRAALAALIAARDACAEAGYRVDCAQIGGREGAALDALVRDAEKRIESIARRARSIALGDAVTVRRNYRDGDDVLTVARVGRTVVHLVDGRRERPFSIEDGYENDTYRHRQIDPDDLARIRRDLVGKRAPKPAPVPQEIAVVETETT